MHPLRLALHNELHSRPSIYFIEPAHVFHVTMLDEEGLMEEINKRLALETEGESQGLLTLDGGIAKWERHTEFLSLTLVMPITDSKEHWPAMPACMGALISDHQHLMIESSIILVENEGERQCDPEIYGFKDASGSEVGAGDAVVWSDFRLTDNGINRFLLINRRLNSYRLGRMVRRILEIETYRTMASLALPLAKSVSASLKIFEKELTALSDENASTTGLDAKKILDEISHLSARIVRCAARARQRFSATQAYSQLVFERIGELREGHVEGRQRIGIFIERRFRPTVRYCDATHQRLERLHGSVANLGDLLQARVQVEVEEQNAAILKSLNARAITQVKIQKAVEGLSIIAISYYFFSLLKLVYEGLHGLGIEISAKDFAMYIAPLAMTTFVLIGLRIIKAKTAD